MQFVKRASIGMKIMVFTGALFLFCTVLSAAVYWSVIEKASRQELERVSGQTLSSINDGMNSQFEYIHRFATALMMGNSFQALVSKQNGEPNLETQIGIERTLYNITEFSDQIGAIIFQDTNGKFYGVKSSGETVGNRISKEKADRFLEAADYRGRWDILPKALLSEPESHISLVFDLQSTTDFRQLGIVIIEINMDKLSGAFRDTLHRYDLDLQIRDSEAGIVKAFDKEAMEDRGESCIAHLTVENDGFTWEYTSIAPMGRLDDAYLQSRKMTLVVLGINSCVLFLGIYVIIRGFLLPLKRMVGVIDRTGEDVLVHVDLKSETKELKQLEKAYNRMTDRIERLLERIVAEQKNLRKMELSLLQAQINPHFLYNTLNDISALIVTDRKAQACHAVKAFSNFYRRTLSKGKDIISLKEELMIVSDYLVVQEIRFESIFLVEREIDESLLEVRVPKLMLQPLVENAIYHGLRPLGHKGTLKITVRKERKETICVIVADNGVGMSERQMQDILNGNRVSEGGSGFGLQKTIERIRLYFGSMDCVELHSRPEEGTEIVIHVTNLNS